jgi:hypothetical protein
MHICKPKVDEESIGCVSVLNQNFDLWKMATELSIRKQKTKFRMRYVLAHDLLDAHVVVYAVVLCVSASVQLTRGGVGDGSRQGPAFSR